MDLSLRIKKSVSKGGVNYLQLELLFKGSVIYQNYIDDSDVSLMKLAGVIKDEDVIKA
jgi:hypothetical protein